ncbi:sensor histidine kinase [Sphingomicrobium astaxanthinifaciens]|uniref:sensor histidine kinase n=1 Tax=Sphingomicrobium astaxanthinifaciens TaxID=1227949 RepID=UPI001FCC9F45|nr:HAMP domain-containing sensor histidine kinase [Sphingomicrobium astaxanthinifaciens]MCJ7420736.1 HAMP domain-containing histidine kinase [Sphingomicrobium astaxanthinifaciens]
MIGIAALWIALLLLAGGYALDRILTRSIVENFDSQLEYILNAMVAASEIGPDGEVRFNRPLADQRFLEIYSGRYFQISGDGADTFASRSLWDRRLEPNVQHDDLDIHVRDSFEFEGEPLRIVERDIILPDSEVRWRFQVAESREELDEQIEELRATLIRSFAVLGLGLLLMAAIQTVYGLWPLRRVRRAVVSIRTAEKQRIDEEFPREITPLVDEINELLAHNEAQAEEARRHAGNLAHALKTPLTVITNAATAHEPDLHDIVCREATVMRRQVDHHLARARAIGRRASAQARANVAESLDPIERAVTRLYAGVTIDVAGDREACVRVEKQDLDEMLGNLVENAAKYGGGRVFVTIEASAPMVDILVEDDGPGIPREQREAIFARGARLDTTGKQGSGLGLAIVRDVAEIYGGAVALSDSEDLGGLLARLSLPAALENV